MKGGGGWPTLSRVPIDWFFYPHDNEGAPSFAESAVLVFARGAKGGSPRM